MGHNCLILTLDFQTKGERDVFFLENISPPQHPQIRTVMLWDRNPVLKVPLTNLHPLHPTPIPVDNFLILKIQRFCKALMVLEVFWTRSKFFASHIYWLSKNFRPPCLLGPPIYLAVESKKLGRHSHHVLNQSTFWNLGQDFQNPYFT